MMKTEDEGNIFKEGNVAPTSSLMATATECMMEEVLLEGDESLMETTIDEEGVTNISQNVVSYNKMIGQLQRRAYANSFISVVAPITTKAVGYGQMFTIAPEYGNPTSTESKIMKVLYMEPILPELLAKGTEVTSADGVKAKVIYMEEGNNNILVEMDDNDILFEQYDTINGSSIDLINNASFGAGHLFENFGGWETTAESELYDDLDGINIIIKGLPLNPITSKVRTNLSQEFFQDFKAIIKAGNQPGLSLRTILRDLLTINIEQKYISYMKSIGTLRPKLVVKAGQANLSSMVQSFSDIYANINVAIGEVGTDTVNSNKFFVVASSNVVAALKTANVVGPSPAKMSNINRVAGVLKNGAILIEDGYGMDDYFMVGLVGTSSILYPSVTYMPYGTTFIEVTDYETLQPALGMIHRCVLEGNGLDTKGKGNAESIQVQPVDLTGIPNLYLR